MLGLPFCGIPEHYKTNICILVTEDKAGPGNRWGGFLDADIKNCLKKRKLSYFIHVSVVMPFSGEQIMPEQMLMSIIV